MTYSKHKWQIAGAAVLAAAALAGCHDDHNDNSSTTPASTKFSTFVANVYAEGANTVPIDISTVNFDFDVDTDPTAFDTLLM